MTIFYHKGIIKCKLFFKKQENLCIILNIITILSKNILALNLGIEMLSLKDSDGGGYYVIR